MSSLFRFRSHFTTAFGGPLFIRHKSRACYKNHSRSTSGRLTVKPKKLLIADNVRRIFDSSQFVAVLHYNDLKTADWNNVRSKLDAHEITLKVVPTKVSVTALKATKFANLCSLMNGATSLAFSDKPCLNDLLKVLKSESKLYLLGGVIEDELMTANSIKEHAKLPNKEMAYLQLLSTLTAQQASLTQLLDHGTRALSNKLDYLANED